MTSDAYTTFIAQLKERRPEIAEFLLSCERNSLTQADYTAMRHSIYRLKEISLLQNPQLYKLALAMEEAINPETQAAQINLLSLARTLLSACHDALIVRSDSTQPSIILPRDRNGQKPTILTVDDDRIIHHMIEGMFGEHAVVLTANNGSEGLDMIRKHSPDLVLLDDAMPQMTGMKMIEELRKVDPAASVSVVMLTSSDRPQDIERATKAMAVDYVIKPFDPKRLASAVSEALGKRH